MAVSASVAAGIREGMSLVEVTTALGEPLSSMRKGDTLVLNYPNGGRVELTGDKVIRLSRVRHFDDPVPSEELAAAKAARAKANKTPANSEKERASAESEWQNAGILGQQDMQVVLGEMTQNQSKQGTGAAMHRLGLTVDPRHFWVELMAALVAQIALGMVLLKLAFSWGDVHADWGQMLLPAFAAASAGALARGSVYALWHTTQLFYLDDAVSYGALLLTLLTSTHACTWQRAAGVGMAAKAMLMVVWLFVGVAIPKILFA